MENLTPEESQFFEWITSGRVKQYWDFNEHGQRLKMISRWEKAEAEYKRIQGIREKSENGLKVSRVTCSIE
jgi:hypothetical protein